MAYFGVAAMCQMLWLNLAPLVSFIQAKYQVSEMMVSSLLLSFPLLYVVLSMHSGTMIDKKGYRYVIILGSVISAFFACVRIFDSNFYLLVIGQTGIAIGQPYIINGISKLVSDWFDKEQTQTASGPLAPMSAPSASARQSSPHGNSPDPPHTTARAHGPAPCRPNSCL